MKKNKLILIVSLIVVFILNTIFVISGKCSGLDTFVHNNVIKLYSEFTTKIMNAFTFLGSTAFIVGFAVGLFIIFLLKKRKAYAFCSASVLIVSTIINNVVKLIIRRPRPSYMMVEENTFSYPSGHMMASVTIYGFLIYLIMKSKFPKKYKIFYSVFLGLLILCVGTSRIYLGAHYFTDIFGGFTASLCLLILFSYLNDKKKWF